MYNSKFKFYSFLLICCTLCLNVSSQDVTADQCILEDKDKKEFVLDRLEEIRDDSSGGQDLLGQVITAGTEVKSITVQVISSKIGGTSKYVSGSLTNGKFKLVLADDFRTYEENESSTEMEIEVILDCGPTKLRRKVFKLSIKDINNHTPDFLEDLYEFELPMPFPKNRSLAPFGKSGLKNIVVKDVDLKNSEVTFNFLNNNENSTDEELFSIEWDKQKDGKMYSAVLKTAKDLYFDKEISLSVQATDNGDPKKNSSKPATIKIRPIKAESIPEFSSVFYFAACEKCKSSDSNAVIIPFKPEIRLTNVTSEQPKIDVKVINAELKDAFTAEIKDSTVQLSLKLPANFKDDYIFLTVTASQPGVESRAFAHITLSKSQPVVEESSNGGLIAATVILSILLIGLLIGAAYYYNKLRDRFSSSLMS